MIITDNYLVHGTYAINTKTDVTNIRITVVDVKVGIV